MIKISDAEKIRGMERRITDFLPEATNEKTLSNILKLLGGKMFELEFYIHRKYLPKTKLK